MPDKQSNLHDVVQDIMDGPIPAAVKERLPEALTPWEIAASTQGAKEGH